MTTKKNPPKTPENPPANPPAPVAPPLPTQAELDTVASYPVHAPGDTVHYRKPPAGFDVIAQKTLTTWQSIGPQLAVPGVSVDALSHALTTHNVLAPIEEKLEPLYEIAHDNRMEADSDAYGLMLKLARVIKNSGDPALMQLFGPLLDFVAETYSHPAHHAAPTAVTTTKA